jgi:hypothetical protein
MAGSCTPSRLVNHQPREHGPPTACFCEASAACRHGLAKGAPPVRSAAAKWCWCGPFDADSVLGAGDESYAVRLVVGALCSSRMLPA